MVIGGCGFDPSGLATFLFVCVRVLGPFNPMGSCPAQSVYLSMVSLPNHTLLDKLSPLSS